MKQRSKSNYIILEHKGEKYQPAISIVDDDGKKLLIITYQQVHILNVNEKQHVAVGDILG